MTRRPDLPCADCGALMWRGATSAPEGEACCRPCRARRPKSPAYVNQHIPKVCEQCGRGYEAASTRTRYCSVACGNYARQQRIRADDDPCVKRRARDVAAPGLTEHQRRAILADWRRQRRACTYCGAPADTVDHVLPLVRGGTNYEGNLTPACRRCNGAKGGLTLVEWRTGKRLAPMREQAQRHRAAMTARRKAKVPVQDAIRLTPCALPGCGGWSVARSKYCEVECADEANARMTRDRYRLAHGLPVDPAEPTSTFDRRRGAFAQVSES